MRELRSYVVRIYRDLAAGMAGTIQEVRSGRTVPFQSMDELWSVLRRPLPPSARRAAASSRKAPSPDQAGPPGRRNRQDREEES